jgi:hypothetical protein
MNKESGYGEIDKCETIYPPEQLLLTPRFSAVRMRSPALTTASAVFSGIGKPPNSSWPGFKVI